MTYPSFSVGDVLTAADMNAVGLWRVTDCTVTSAGGTAATASNGVITIGSGNTSVSVINAFSATYDNYRIMINITSNSTNNGSCMIRLRTSGNVDSTTGYTYAFIYANPSTGVVSGAGGSNANRYDYAVNLIGTSGGASNIDIFSPYKTERTVISNLSPRGDLMGSTSGFHNVATSYPSFTLADLSGTITGGTIRVYGYRN